MAGAEPQGCIFELSRKYVYLAVWSRKDEENKGGLVVQILETFPQSELDTAGWSPDSWPPLRTLGNGLNRKWRSEFKHKYVISSGSSKNTPDLKTATITYSCQSSLNKYNFSAKSF